MKRLMQIALIAALLPLSAHAQAAPTLARSTVPIGIRFAGTRANSPPGTCGCFWLTGAAADAALPIASHFAAVVEVAGSTISRVPASPRGLSTITLLAGPRYALPFRHFTLQAQALFGAARGFDADFISGPAKTDTATAFGMSAGAIVEVPITNSIALRPVQVEYLQTDLPNGVDNRQRNLRAGAGIVFRVRLPASQR